MSRLSTDFRHFFLIVLSKTPERLTMAFVVIKWVKHFFEGSSAIMLKKRLVSLLLILILAASLSVCACAESVTLSDSAQAMHFILRDDGGVLTITPGVLGTGEPAYFIGLEGTGYTITHANNFVAYILSTFSLSTSYLRMARSAICDNVPKGAKIVFAGHSLGGTTAQQLASDKTVKAAMRSLMCLPAAHP